MRLKVYQYAKCSTCRKALNWLRTQGVDFATVDIVTAPPSKQELKDVLEKSGLPIKKLFNTSGQSYRDGGFGARLPEMSDAQALSALAEDGKLIKRPLVIGKDFALVGFDEKAYRARLA
jgi:arsenate reductase (glutaredoxin)